MPRKAKANKKRPGRFWTYTVFVKYVRTYVGATGDPKRAHRQLLHLQVASLREVLDACDPHDADVEVVEYATHADAFALGVALIARYGRLDLNTGTLVNRMNDGGECAARSERGTERRPRGALKHNADPNLSRANITSAQDAAGGSRFRPSERGRVRPSSALRFHGSGKPSQPARRDQNSTDGHRWGRARLPFTDRLA